jgi:hypothetical protein
LGKIARKMRYPSSTLTIPVLPGMYVMVFTSRSPLRSGAFAGPKVHYRKANACSARRQDICGTLPTFGQCPMLTNQEPSASALNWDANRRKNFDREKIIEAAA